MAEITYTQGPWELVKESNGIHKRIIARDGRTIAQVEEGDTPEKVWGCGFLLANADALYEASVALRAAQKAHMADRGNEEKGRTVAQCAETLDAVLECIDSGEHKVE